jgi:uridine kinase
MEQYLSTVKPMHEQFIEPTKKHADLIIPEGANSVAVSLLEEKVAAEVGGDTVRDWERSETEFDGEVAGTVSVDERDD